MRYNKIHFIVEERKENNFKGKITLTGTFDSANIVNILKRHKLGVIDLADAVMEFIEIME